MFDIKIQVALDGATKGRTLDDCVSLLDDIHEYVDIIEVGTSFIYRYGIEAIKVIKSKFPNIVILADMKIMDGGYHNTGSAFDYGADIVTVLGVSSCRTIILAQEAAKKRKKEIMIDLINVQNFENVIKCSKDCNISLLCFHLGVDDQADTNHKSIDYNQIVRLKKEKFSVAIAGGLDENNIDEIIQLEPNILIFGNSINNSKNPKKTVSTIYKKLKNGMKNNEN